MRFPVVMNHWITDATLGIVEKDRHFTGIQIQPTQTCSLGVGDASSVVSGGWEMSFLEFAVGVVTKVGVPMAI